MTQKKLKALHAEYMREQTKANEAFRAWDSDPMNEEKEAASDAADMAAWEKFIALADGIVEFTAGRIDKKTACAMIRKKGEKLVALFSRI